MRGDVPEPNLPPTLIGVRRPVLFVGAVAGLLFACWALALTGYLCFQDEIAAVLLRRQADMQYGYEAQISGLRAQLERNVTQALVERQKLEGRINGLSSRQAQIEARQATINAFAERTIGPVTTPSSAAIASTPEQDNRKAPSSARLERVSKPTPIGDSAEQGERQPARTAPSVGADGLASEKLSQIEGGLDRTSGDQIRSLGVLQKTAQRRLDLLDGAIASIGLDPNRLEPPDSAKAESGIGGPLVSLPWNAATSPFDLTTGELESTIQRFTKLRQVARSLPLTRPVSGNLEPTSPFGPRTDPFTRSVALHTGMDLRAEYGTEVRATGPGRVTAAEVSGGYGNMVEIDHGNDVVTRYAHLSIIGVSEGQEIAAGAIIGHVGSTGRSTGAHLHYETRIGGDPVNPQRFLQAGALLSGGPQTR